MFDYLFFDTGFPVHVCLLGLVLFGIKVLLNENK